MEKGREALNASMERKKASLFIFIFIFKKTKINK